MPSERTGSSADVAAEKQLLRDEIVGRDNPELMEWLTQEGKLDWFRNLGSDQVIVSYAFNFKTANGLNTDLKRMNELNDALFKKMSVVAHAEDLPDVPLFVTSSKLDATTHGSALLSDFKRRLGIVDATEGPVSFLISTVMNPWLSDTADGDQTSRIVDLLRDQVTALIAEHPNFR